jgi:Ku protein
MSIGTSHGGRRPEPKPVTAVEVPEFPSAKPILEIVMAARAYWKGSLKLSLVSCPVLLYPASTSVDKTHFHMINKETGNRLKQQMVDAETGDIVESNQKARGYELKKDEYVEIENEELEAVQIESNHTIDIDRATKESIDCFVAQLPQ